MDIALTLLLLVLGLFAGTYGAIVGAGGGFVLVPVLLLLPMFQGLTPQAVTGISLIAVFFNAVASTQSFLRQKRVDIPVALLFAVFAIPGSVLGRTLVSTFARGPFEIAFGVLLLVLGGYLLVRKPPKRKAAPDGALGFGRIRREFHGADGKPEIVVVDLRLGAFLSFSVGFLAAMFGIGGGILLVPMLVSLLTYPPHLATATSQFFLMLTSFVSVMTDLATNSSILANNWFVALPLAVGMIGGGLFGASLSKRLHGVIIVRLLAGALMLAGVRLIALGMSR